MKASRTQQSEETKKIIKKAKTRIDKGENWKTVIDDLKSQITDSIQREKAVKSIIDYI